MYLPCTTSGAESVRPQGFSQSRVLSLAPQSTHMPFTSSAHGGRGRGLRSRARYGALPSALQLSYKLAV